MEYPLILKLKMWRRCTSIKIKKDKQFKDSKRSMNVNEEYQGTIRSKSFVEFLSKAHLLVHDQSLSSMTTRQHILLLEPDQEAIHTLLDSKSMSKNFPLILDYFNISSEASNMCTNLLKSILELQSTYADSNICYEIHFANISKQDFEVICDKYSSTLQKMKIKRRKLSRKIKLISWFNKASRICVTAACCVVAVAAMALAAHTLTALVTGPVILSLPYKKLGNLEVLSSKFLRRGRDEVDVAMKGTFILNRDFDTMSRLVDRLHDDIQRNQRMVELWFAKGREAGLQVLREVEKSDVWFREQVEELKEHIYLCLLTINKARALVIKELLKS